MPPEFYNDHIKKHDIRFFDEIGGGRIHYCGNSREMARIFMTLDNVCGGDICPPYYDSPLDVCNEIPAEKVPLIPIGNCDSELCREILNGKVPKKRNIILRAEAPDIESGKILLKNLRKAFEKAPVS